MTLLQNQTKVKYNMYGAPGLTVNITLHPTGNRSITVLSVKAESCPIPVETGTIDSEMFGRTYFLLIIANS